MCDFDLTDDNYYASCDCHSCTRIRLRQKEPNCSCNSCSRKENEVNEGNTAKKSLSEILCPSAVSYSREIGEKLSTYFNTPFYLTGSQFFSGKGKDYDYFAKYSSELEKNLVKEGFFSLNVKTYLQLRIPETRQDIVAVYRKETGYGTVDVQLVNDPIKKDLFQGILFDVFSEFNKMPSKEIRSMMWELMYRISDSRL